MRHDVVAWRDVSIVHGDDGHAARRGDGSHGRVALQSVLVVDDTRAKHERTMGYLGLGRVDGDRYGTLGGEPLDDRADAPEFFVEWDGLVTGARRFTADINEISPLVDERERVLDGARGVGIQATIRERVGRHVQDAHDERAPVRAVARQQGQQGGRGHELVGSCIGRVGKPA